MQNSLEVHGHRGSRATHPENTMAAFEEAYLAGADAFELDTQWTADGVAIVFHDFDVSSRSCLKKGTAPNRPIKIIDHNWNEIEVWDVGSVAQPKYPKQILSFQKILTLDSLLSWVAKKPSPFYVNIEMKVAPEWSDALVESYTANVLGLVKKHGLERRCLLMSFDFRPLRFIKQNLASLKSSCLFERAENFVAVAIANGVGQIGPHFSLLSEALVTQAHLAGLRVIPWTVNEAADWARLKNWGVDGLITDHPRDLVAFLGRKGRD